MANPFSVFTPEGLTAEEVVSIFYPECRVSGASRIRGMRS
jgi:hypothetical protein